MIILSYKSLTTIVPGIYCHLTHQTRVDQPVWHTLYCGLGWEENKYGIIWLDECGYAAAQQVNPNVELNSKEYFDIMKDVYLQILKNDPGYIIGTYTRKLFYCVKELLRYLFSDSYFGKKELLWCGAILFLINRYIFNREHQFKQLKVIVLFSAFCGFTMLIFPMIAMIAPGYLQGSYGAADLIVFSLVMATLGTLFSCLHDLIYMKISS